jgi:nucleotide-binding universal stress UspA family protein
MHAWKHVFVHVDPRPHAPVALSKALAVAEAFGGRVTAFDSVSAAEALPWFSSAETRAAADHVLDLAVQARTRELREELARLEQRVPVQASVAKGVPDDALLRHAQLQAADLILKAVSAEDFGEGKSAGAATQRLLREAPVPIWLCSPRRRRANRVLTAVNFATAERASASVLRAGARVASLHDAELHVLCVDRQASRHFYELEARPPPSELVQGDGVLADSPSLANASRRGHATTTARAIALETIEKAVLDLEPDILVTSRDAAALSGLPGSHLVERLFCRVECSMLLLPPARGAQEFKQEPRRFWAPRPPAEHYASAARA